VIGLDTNVVVRYLVRDDAHQTALVDALFSELTAAEPGYVSLVVAVETWWVLRTSYGVSADECRAVLAALVEATELVVERPDVVRQALSLAAAGADFADALIALLGRTVGCSATATFDRGAARLAGMRLLG
jgi:predicted nucleic-acid-binding protein